MPAPPGAPRTVEAHDTHPDRTSVTGASHHEAVLDGTDAPWHRRPRSPGVLRWWRGQQRSGLDGPEPGLERLQPTPPAPGVAPRSGDGQPDAAADLAAHGCGHDHERHADQPD